MYMYKKCVSNLPTHTHLQPPLETKVTLEQEPEENVRPQVWENEQTLKEEVEDRESVKGGVERVVEEVREEVERMAGEVREEKVKEQQEAQMADQQLSWLKDSAQVTPPSP